MDMRILSRTSKAQQIKNSVMRVDDNTFAVPSQTRTGKAHIVKCEMDLNKIVPIENKFLIEASYILNNLSISQYRSIRVKNLLIDLARRKEQFPEIYTCTCEDFKFNGLNTCKHIIAVEMNL